ncbi:FkbM family methyltransferase [Mycolicibacterium sp.]|uniref:FkbM family methyltransferase n=1 Tax=Mycolicibacterium sp. TaxID=2320850 RepID=UPI003D0A989A
MSVQSLELLSLRVRKVFAGLQSRPGRAALRLGVAPSIEHRHLSGLYVEHLLDIGANRGQFSLFAHSVWGTRRIDAFEPLPECAAEISSILPFVSVHEIALSDSEGQRTFHVSRANDSSSLRQITTNQTRHFPGTEEAGTRIVNATTFEKWCADKALGRPSFAKIDVQGSELNVLQGMGKSIDQLDYIYAELSFMELYEGQALAGEIIGYLDDAGFDLKGLHNIKQDGVFSVQADALFRRRAMAGST